MKRAVLYFVSTSENNVFMLVSTLVSQLLSPSNAMVTSCTVNWAKMNVTVCRNATYKAIKMFIFEIRYLSVKQKLSNNALMPQLFLVFEFRNCRSHFALQCAGNNYNEEYQPNNVLVISRINGQFPHKLTWKQ